MTKKILIMVSVVMLIALVGCSQETVEVTTTTKPSTKITATTTTTTTTTEVVTTTTTRIQSIKWTSKITLTGDFQLDWEITRDYENGDGEDCRNRRYRKANFV